jgi:hypothetical protein
VTILWQPQFNGFTLIGVRTKAQFYCCNYHYRGPLGSEENDEFCGDDDCLESWPEENGKVCPFGPYAEEDTLEYESLGTGEENITANGGVQVVMNKMDLAVGMKFKIQTLADGRVVPAVESYNVVVDIDRKELVYHFWGSFWPSLANAFRAFFEHTVLTKIREGLETLLSETIPDKVNGFFEHSDGKSNLPVVNWTIDWEAPEALTVSNYGFEVGVKGLFFDSEIGEEPPAVDIPELPSYIEGNPAGF